MKNEPTAGDIFHGGPRRWRVDERREDEPRRIVIEPGETFDEGKRGPWVKLTWQEAEALFAAAQSQIARGYRPNVLVDACSKLRHELDAFNESERRRL